MPKLLRESLEGRENLQRVLANIVWLYADRILRMGIGLLVGVWLARYLGPAQFGLLSFSLSLVGLFGAFSSLGLQNIIVRNLVNTPSDANKILGTGFFLQVIAGVLTCLLVLSVITVLRPDDAPAKAIIAILGSSLAFKASDVVRYWFESQVQSKYTVWVENAIFLLVASAKVGMIVSDAPLIAFVWVMLAESVAVSISLLSIYAKKGGSLAAWIPSFPRARSLLSDSWPVIISGVAVMIYMKIDQVMIGQMIDDEAVGIYSAAVRLSEVWYFIAIGIIASVVPTLIESKNRSEALFIARTQKLYDLMVLLAISVAVPLSLFSQEVVTLIFGAAYAAAGDILTVHLWAAIFVFLGKASSNWFFVQNRQILILQRSLLGMTINVGLNLLMIPTYGALGAAWATVLSYAMVSFAFDAVQRETRPIFWMKVRALNVFRSVSRLFLGRI